MLQRHYQQQHRYLLPEQNMAIILSVPLRIRLILSKWPFSFCLLSDSQQLIADKVSYLIYFTSEKQIKVSVYVWFFCRSLSLIHISVCLTKLIDMRK
jgi:hypothetical protein